MFERKIESTKRFHNTMGKDMNYHIGVRKQQGKYLAERQKERVSYSEQHIDSMKERERTQRDNIINNFYLMAHLEYLL